MRYTEKINKKNSVSKLEKILIDKNYHWMMFRGEDISNPLLLFWRTWKCTNWMGSRISKKTGKRIYSS